MRRLTLLRHAHAEERHPSGRDFERRLDAHGLEEAQHCAGRLLKQLATPSLIIASPAQRTRQTAQALLQACGLPAAALRFDERLYNAAPLDILAVIHAADADCRHLLVVGHNPGISELGRQLTGDAPDGLATAEFCSASFAQDWTEIGTGRCQPR